MAELKAGERAPDFDLPTDGAGRVSLAGLKGQTVVLYFYPKDDTSGCTSEAQGFSNAYKQFEDIGAVVIGLSKDTPSSHDKFKAKHDLSITLASDTGGETVEAYGAWVEKSMYGRKYMGIDRSTVLIDGEGRVQRIWRKVKVPGHVEEVLKAARELSRETAAAD